MFSTKHSIHNLALPSIIRNKSSPATPRPTVKTTKATTRNSPGEHLSDALPGCLRFIPEVNSVKQVAVCFSTAPGRFDWKSSQKIHNFCVRFPDFEGRIEVSVESGDITGRDTQQFHMHPAA